MKPWRSSWLLLVGLGLIGWTAEAQAQFFLGGRAPTTLYNSPFGTGSFGYGYPGLYGGYSGMYGGYPGMYGGYPGMYGGYYGLGALARNMPSTDFPQYSPLSGTGLGGMTTLGQQQQVGILPQGLLTSGHPSYFFYYSHYYPRFTAGLGGPTPGSAGLTGLAPGAAGAAGAGPASTGEGFFPAYGTIGLAPVFRAGR
jgi:hypothetical protein